MVRSRFYLLLVTMLVLALFVAGCQSTGTTPAAPAADAPAAAADAPAAEAPAAEAPAAEAPAAVPAGGTVRVMTSWPLQGPMLPEGESMERAVELALKHYLEANDGNGPGGLTVEVVNLDDASPTTGSWDATIESENAQKCVNDPACMVYFGTYNSGAAKVSMPITNKAGVAQITPANTYPGLTKEWDAGEPGIYRPSGEVNYFRTNAADDVQGQAGAAWAKCMGFDKVYFLDDRQLYGKGVVDAFIQQAEKVGIEVVGRDGVESTDIDFRALLTKVKAANPDLVYGGFVIDSGGPQIIQQMASLGLFEQGIKFMGPDGLVNPALVEQVGGPDVANENIFLTFPGLAPSQLTSVEGKKFFDDFIAEYGVEPSPWSTYAYQSMQVILYALEQGGADRAGVLNAMRGLTDFQGVTGTFGFDANGDPTITALGGNEVIDGDITYVGAISPDMYPDKCSQ